jgi:hypothetical protein
VDEGGGGVLVVVTVAVGAAAAVGVVGTRWRARVRTAATSEVVMRVVLGAWPGWLEGPAGGRRVVWGKR